MERATEAASESAPPEFDEFAGNYDEALNRGLKLSGEPKEYFAKGRVEWLKSCLKELGVSSIDGCLDFGCGTGTAAPFLLEGLGAGKYLGYDPSGDSITQAEAAYGGLGTFTSLAADVPRGEIDVAFCNGVFHHIPLEARTEAAKLVFEALKPGGYFAFWENNRWNPMVHLIMSRVPFDRDALMLFPHQARRLLRGVGFEVCRTDSLFVFPSVLGGLRFLEPALCKLMIGGQYLVLVRKPGSSS